MKTCPLHFHPYKVPSANFKNVGLGSVLLKALYCYEMDENDIWKNEQVTFVQNFSETKKNFQKSGLLIGQKLTNSNWRQWFWECSPESPDSD